MAVRFKHVALLVTLIGTAAVTAHAQDGPTNLPAPEDIERGKQPTGGKSFLERKFNLSASEAQSRLDRQAEAEALSVQLSEAYSDAFLGLKIQHEPTYKVVLSLASDQFDSQVRKLIPPKLRSFVQIRRSRLAIGEVETTRTALISVLGNSGYELAFDYSRDRFVIRTPKDNITKLRALVPPQFRALVEFQEGDLTTTSQSNATASDILYGGWSHYGDRGTNYYCTFAFTARDQSGNQGLLTAEHCQDSPSETRRNDENTGRKIITFFNQSDSRYRRYAYESGATNLRRTYDFRFIPATTVRSGPLIYYYNPREGSYTQDVRDSSAPNGWRPTTVSYSNYHSGLPANDYLRVIGSLSSGTTTEVYNPGHPNGAVRCKSGRTTGITCGIIVNSSYYGGYNDDNILVDGMVQVGGSDQRVISDGGDSGGAVFDAPRYDSASGYHQVQAAGILHGSNKKAVNPVFSERGECPCDNQTSDTDCWFVYMPLDRVNDFAPMTINVWRNGISTFVAP